MTKLTKYYIILITFLLFIVPSISFAKDNKDKNIANFMNTIDRQLDSVGELLKSLKKINNLEKIIPDNTFRIEEDIRDRFGIPLRVPILSPNGGDEIIVFVFEVDGYVHLGNDEDYIIIGDYYKHFKSTHNLKKVYLLYDLEPVRIDGYSYMFERIGDVILVYFVVSNSVEETLIDRNTSLYLRGSKHIIKAIKLK